MSKTEIVPGIKPSLTLDSIEETREHNQDQRSCLLFSFICLMKQQTANNPMLFNKNHSSDFNFAGSEDEFKFTS